MRLPDPMTAFTPPAAIPAPTMQAASNPFRLSACQLQPLVLPQLGQAWHEPARCIWTPHCMQYGASETVLAAVDFGAGATGVVSVRSRSSSVMADSTDGGSGGISDPCTVSMTDSSTPGNVGCV